MPWAERCQFNQARSQDRWALGAPTYARQDRRPSPKAGPEARMLDSARLDELLLQWETALESGCLISPEELCANWPEALPELQRRIGQLQQLAPVLALDGPT